MSWYAIFVETGKEDIVRSKIIDLLKQINYKDEYELLIPKKIMQDRHQGKFVEVLSTLFPGYLLVKSNEIIDLFQHTNACRYLYRYLKTDEEFLEIALEEIANIVYMTNEDGIIGISEGFIENDIVKVISGPLCNYTGWIKKIDNHKRRAKVLFKFQGEDHFIDLSINLIRKPSDEEIKSEIPFYRQ